VVAGVLCYLDTFVIEYLYLTCQLFRQTLPTSHHDLGPSFRALFSKSRISPYSRAKGVIHIYKHKTTMNIQTIQSSLCDAAEMEEVLASTTLIDVIPFPSKLHDMLDAAESEGFNDVVSWQQDGTSFKVNQPKVFVNDIIPKYFSMTKYKSFVRQLNLYCFSRVTNGPERGCYSHNSFVKDEKDRCKSMTRQRLKGTHTRTTKKDQAKSSKSQQSSTCSTTVSTEYITVQQTGSQDYLLSLLSNSDDVISIFRQEPEVVQEDASQTAVILDDFDAAVFAGRNFFMVEDYADAPSYVSEATTKKNHSSSAALNCLPSETSAPRGLRAPGAVAA
jgi:hypothetical protein